MPGIADFLRGMFIPPQPTGAAAPMNAPQPMNPLASLTQWNSDNPGVLSSIGAGMMSGDMGGGFAQAGQYRALAQGKQQDRAEKTRTNNLTRQWLTGRKGLSEADADAALANPAILSDLLKAPAGPDYMSVGDGVVFNKSDGSFIQGPNAGGAKNDYADRQAAAAQFGLSPNDPAYQSFVLTGKMPREDAQELTATDKKAMWSAEDEIPVLDNTLSSLQRAKELNKKTFTGYTAGIRGNIGTKMPGGDYFVDGEAAKATSEFNKIMSMEAIQNMAKTLSGATTNEELARFVDILADPNADPDIRERTIDRMIQLTERVKDVKSQRIKSIKGDDAPAQGGGWQDLGGGVRVRQVR